MHVAYIMSRFPKLTETFILMEMVAMERLGARVDVFPLLREKATLQHKEAAKFVERAHYCGFLSWAILRDNLRVLKASPRLYLSTLWEVLRESWGNANYFAGALALFPKAIHFAREMKRTGVRHVHAHFSNHPAVCALVIHRVAGIPFSFTAHGHDIHVDTTMLAHKVKNASFAVTISGYNRRLIQDVCHPEDRNKVHVIHCGVDTTELHPVAKRETTAPMRMICVGSLLEVKGHTHLIDACSILASDGIAFECHLVGNGPLRNDIERKIAENGLASRVILHGAVERSRVLELLREADVIVQPSVRTTRGSREGIPVSLMEGMAFGLPVVASEISGIPELVTTGVSGLLVPPGEASLLAAALSHLAKYPEVRARMGAAGREAVVREFDLIRSAAKLLGMFSAAQQPVHSVAA